MCPLDLKSKNTVSMLSLLRLTDEKYLIPSLQMLPGRLGKFTFTPQHLAPDPVCSLSCLLRGRVALTDWFIKIPRGRVDVSCFSCILKVRFPV